MYLGLGFKKNAYTPLRINGGIREICSFPQVWMVLSESWKVTGRPTMVNSCRFCKAVGHLPVSDNALKKEDFPTFGRPGIEVSTSTAQRSAENKPTMPILRLLPGLPRRIFFSWAAAFFGGILFLMLSGAVEENGL